MHESGFLAVDALAVPGSYVLFLDLAEGRSVQLGRLGVHYLQPGCYAYAGSALGSGGLRGRLRHHLKPASYPHWHIDYLRQIAAIQQIWVVEASTRYEHVLAALLRQLPGATLLVRKFGASDCDCESHLVYFPAPPSIEDFGSQAVTFPALQARVLRLEN